MPVVEGRRPLRTARARRVAKWRLRVGIGKGGATGSQRIHARRLGLRVSTEITHPVIEIVNHDH